MGVMPYAGFAKDNWRAHTGARYGRDDNSADRPLSMTDTTARADYNTDSWAAWGEVGRDFGLADGLTLTPLANVSWARVNGVDTEESGAGLLNSYLELDDYNSLRHLLGATLAATVDMGLDRDISLQFTAGWRHEYLDTRTQSSAELAGTTRTLDGPDSDHDALSAELQISCPLPGGGGPGAGLHRRFFPEHRRAVAVVVDKGQFLGAGGLWGLHGRGRSVYFPDVHASPALRLAVDV